MTTKNYYPADKTCFFVYRYAPYEGISNFMYCLQFLHALNCNIAINYCIFHVNMYKEKLKLKKKIINFVVIFGLKIDIEVSYILVIFKA